MNINKTKYSLSLILVSIITVAQCYASEQDAALDTISLKQTSSLVDRKIISLQQLSANNTHGGGLFVQQDSVVKEGIIAFDNPIIGKQWIRLDYLNDTTLNVMWAGAFGDGQHEDAASIQRAIIFANQSGNKSIYFPSGTYLIENTIEISSKLTLYGEGILLAKRINPSLEIDGKLQTTFYPTTIFRANGINSITIEGLSFDGNWQANKNNKSSSNRGRSFGTPEKYVSNLLRFNNSNNIDIQNCTIINYSSNWGGQLGDNGAICINSCSQIFLKDIRFSNSRTEGIILLKSKDIVIDKLITNNIAVWTPIHAWYCNNLSMTNCEIVQQMNNKGSTLNLASSNVHISNSTFIGGSGIDLGNEAGESFNIYNITIDSCLIENLKFGIYSDNTPVTDFTFTNNYVHVGIIGVSLYNFKSCLVENNFISAKDEGTLGVKLALNIENVQLKNNIIHADCGINGRVESDGEFLSNIIISGNTIKAHNLKERSDYQANSSGIYFRKFGTSTGTSTANIKITENKIIAEGSWIFIVNDLGEQNNFNVTSNYCYSSKIGCKRGLQLGFNENLTVNDNILYDCWSNMIVGNENINISNNRITYLSYNKPTADGVGFVLRNNSGNRITQNNYMYNNIGSRPFFYTPGGYENSFNNLVDNNNWSK